MTCFALVGIRVLYGSGGPTLPPCEQAGETALVKAAGNGHHECVSTLIANGATQVIHWINLVSYF